jgi:hypothetical protein
VAVGEHVDVGVRHAPAVEFAGGVRERAIAEAALAHERAKRVSKWLVARALHADLVPENRFYDAALGKSLPRLGCAGSNFSRRFAERDDDKRGRDL